MALQKKSMDALHHFLPANTFDDVINYLNKYGIKLKITKERKTILGNYRPAFKNLPHTITVNGNLHPFHFFVTFIHELAHLICYEKYSNKVNPHGKEWKSIFSEMLIYFIKKEIFPADIKNTLLQYTQEMKATTCSDPALYKVLSKYDKNEHTFYVDELQIGDIFSTKEGIRYEVLEKRRTRYACKNIENKKIYLFPGIYEVFKE